MKTTMTKDGKRKAGCLAVLAVLLLLAAGCRKDLCYNHDEHSIDVKTDIAADWEQVWEREYRFDWDELWPEEWPRGYEEFTPEAGSGIRAMVYTNDRQEASTNLDAEGGRLPMQEGRHTLMFYNNDTEYIVFDETNNTATATASTRTRTRATFQELHANERTITPPDMLYGAYVHEFIAEETLQAVELPIEMRPLTYSYLIRYRFKSGQQYIAQAKGALAGVADKVYLRDGHTDEVTATLLFDCKVDEQGCTALVEAFGAPSYSYTEGYTADPATHHYTLNLEVVLKNGKHLTYNFDVSPGMRAQPRGGILLEEDIVISDEDGQAGSGGFYPDVEDWGDEIEVPLPLN